MLANLGYADDVVLLAKKPSELKNKLENLQRALEEIGLTANKTETKIETFN